MKPLTAKQVECLRELSNGDALQGFYASTTISRLRKDGLITGISFYRITDAGRAAIAGREALKGAR